MLNFNKQKLIVILSKIENLVIIEHVLLKVSQHNEITLRNRKEVI